MENKKKLEAEIILILVTVIWGGTFSVIKSGLNEITPFLLLFLRFSIAFICLALVSYRDLKTIRISTIRRGVLIGFFMIMGYGLQTLGLQYTTVAKSSLITYSLALYIPFLQYFIVKKKLLPGNIMGLLVVMVGMYIITAPENARFNRGDCYTLLSALSYAFYIIFIDLFNQKENPRVVTLIQVLTSACFSLLAVFFWKYLK